MRNDGKVIPIVKHSKEDIYVPELIFGQQAATSMILRMPLQVHGYGAKLANIFSHHFSIEMYDSEESKLYKQQWSQNMFECGEPVVESGAEGDGGISSWGI